MKAVILFAGLALAGCAHRGPALAAPPVSRPHVIVRQPEAVRPPLAKVWPSPTETPRPRHCRVPGAPPFPDGDRDITGSTGLIERVQRLHQGRDARIVYERELTAAIKECSR